MTLMTEAPRRHADPRWITAARIAGLGVYLPDARRSTAETEARLAAENPGLRLPSGIIERLTGVQGVHVRPDGWQTSDLAVAAARHALEQSPGPVDLLVFASASQDLIEPATAHIVAAKYDITVALHTDHCPKDKLDGYVRPLLEVSAERVARGENPLFQSHMWDGSAETLSDNLAIGQELLAKAAAAKIILEVEITPTGGEEDGVSHEINEHLYTTLDDAIQTVEALGLGENGRYMAALTFGNVHGVYAPGNVKLRPELLKEIQDGLAARYGIKGANGSAPKPLDLVFHGGSGSSDEEIAEAVRNGVVKMNIDTDTQYAFTRSIAGYMFQNYEGVLKVDGSVGNKKKYDPRAWGKVAETAMAARVGESTRQLGSAGKSISA